MMYYRCKKHGKYAGKRKPKHNCAGCWYLYLKIETDDTSLIFNRWINIRYRR